MRPSDNTHYLATTSNHDQNERLETAFWSFKQIRFDEDPIFTIMQLVSPLPQRIYIGIDNNIAYNFDKQIFVSRICTQTLAHLRLKFKVVCQIVRQLDERLEALIHIQDCI